MAGNYGVYDQEESGELQYRYCLWRELKTVVCPRKSRSYDSRFWGAVSKDKVKGRVKSIYWSWDKDKVAVRWDRVGMKVL
jgi:hypothetical protein